MPGSEFTFSTNPFHNSLFVPIGLLVGLYSLDPDLYCSTIFIVLVFFLPLLGRALD